MNEINITITDGKWSCGNGTWLWFNGSNMLQEEGYLARVSRISDEAFRIGRKAFTEESFYKWLQENQTTCTFETDQPMPIYQAAYFVTPWAQISPLDGVHVVIEQTSKGWYWLVLDGQYSMIEDGHINSMTKNIFQARDEVLTLHNLMDYMLWPEDVKKINSMKLFT